MLCIPLLIYGFGLSFSDASALSLGIVGLTALYGLILNHRKGLVCWPIGLFLGLGGLFGAPMGVKIGSHIPDAIACLLFACLMSAIAFKMIRGSQSITKTPDYTATKNLYISTHYRGEC